MTYKAPSLAASPPGAADWAGPFFMASGSSGWTVIHLPHTSFLEPGVLGTGWNFTGGAMEGSRVGRMAPEFEWLLLDVRLAEAQSMMISLGGRKRPRLRSQLPRQVSKSSISEPA